MRTPEVKALIAKLDELACEGNPIAARWALAFAVAPPEKHQELAEVLVARLRKIVTVLSDIVRNALPRGARRVLYEDTQ